MDTLRERGSSVLLVTKPKKCTRQVTMARSRKKYKNEKCVACGARTNYSKEDPIDYRYGYVEGEGQFCFKCSYFGTTKQGN